MSLRKIGRYDPTLEWFSTKTCLMFADKPGTIQSTAEKFRSENTLTINRTGRQVLIKNDELLWQWMDRQFIATLPPLRAQGRVIYEDDDVAIIDLCYHEFPFGNEVSVVDLAPMVGCHKLRLQKMIQRGELQARRLASRGRRQVVSVDEMVLNLLDEPVEKCMKIAAVQQRIVGYTPLGGAVVSKELMR